MNYGTNMEAVELEPYCDVEYMECQILICMVIIKLFKLHTDTWTEFYPVIKADEITAGEEERGYKNSGSI